MSEIDLHRLAFLRGVLAAFASTGQTVTYDEIRRLCRFNDEQLGTYLGQARRPLTKAEQPDFCAVVIGDTTGWPGPRWSDNVDGTDPAEWAQELRRAHRFWKDRRNLDNPAFRKKWGKLPTIPGLGKKIK